jgi:hypothetical protein
MDEDSFHSVFADTLGFPDFYGRNMNAWIDCLTYADEDDGMRNFVVPSGDVLTLDLGDVTGFASRCPELFDDLVECAAFVNHRRMEAGDRPIIALSYRRER